MQINPQIILSAIDFSDFTDSLLSCSVALGKALGARLLLAHVTVDVGALLEHNETALDISELQQANILDAKKGLEELTATLPLANEIVVLQGAPADEISRLAAERKADLVITATYGKSGFKRLLLGSVTEKLIKTLSCPLLVLPPREHGAGTFGGGDFNLKNILVGCDFSPNSKLAVGYALDLARAFQAALYLAHVVKPSRYQDKRETPDDLYRRLERELDSLVDHSRRDGCRAEIILLEGDPSKKLMAFAEQRDIDLVVLGVHGHTLWEKLMVGSTTDRLVRHAMFPVLAVR